MKIKKNTKYVIGVMCIVIIIYEVYLNCFPTILIKNFDELEDEYITIVKLVEKYYNQQSEGTDIYINIYTYTGNYELYHNDVEIQMTSYEQNCLEKICKENYYRAYRTVRVTEFDISFWEGETVEYAMVYSKNLRETRKMIDKYSSDECKFRQVKGQWYELTNYHM